MKKSLDNYFTTGELAKACHILRKTLLFYDKLGLIQPEVILDNGYRYYKRAQLFLLELVVTLRNIDIPLTRIQAYLANRSPATYQRLLKEQQEHIQQEIKRLEQLNKNLNTYIQDLDKQNNLSYGIIQAVQCPEQYLFVTNGCKQNESFKERSLHAARLFLLLRDKLPFKQHVFGYIVNEQALYDTKKYRAEEYFYPLQQPFSNIPYRVRPAGTYLTLYFQGVYMHNSAIYLSQMGEYCQKNNITTISDIYVTSLLNYWTTTNNEEYVYKLEVRIK